MPEGIEEPVAKELARLVVMGSVDDGKSTLIGRLLYETGSLALDHIEQVRRASHNGDPIDFSLFTDGLKAEREQGITIDVAYRYFETPRRKFILADTPGHAQYTRNMATGASTAQAGIILVDARLGVLPQTRRHATIAALLRIPRLAVAINKMDLVGFDPAVFERIGAELSAFAARLGFSTLTFLPVSAREGDNVARRSPRTPWHHGGTVLDFLEGVEIASDRARAPFRLPVQTVLRPHLDYRAFAGSIASGSVAVGDEVVVLPAGTRTRVSAIDTFDGELPRASAPLSVALRLADAVDVGRGDLLAHPGDAPAVRRAFEATAVWLSERPLDPARSYLVKHTTRTVPARVEEVRFRLDPETLAEEPAAHLALNDIGRLVVRCARPLIVDAYADNRATGAFILIDALSNETAAAGAILLDDGGADRDREQGRGAVVVVDRREEGAALALAHQLEAMLSERGYLAAVVRRPEAAAACAAAGVLALWAGNPATLSVETRALLRESGCGLVDLPAQGDASQALERALGGLSGLVAPGAAANDEAG